MPSPARLSTAAANRRHPRCLRRCHTPSCTPRHHHLLRHLRRHRSFPYLLSYLGFLCLTLLQDPGRTAADTKHDLTANPLGFLARSTSLWDSTAPMGQLQNQAYGYLFPQGPFFAFGHLLHLPGWLTQRLWWALLLWVGFWGIMWLARTLRIGGPRSRVAGALVYVLSPRILTTLGAISSESLPYMLAPWVLVPVVWALDGNGLSSGASGPRPAQLRHAAFLSAVAVACMGAVNATATLAAVLVSILWWLLHRPSGRWARFTGWWMLGGVLACTWWIGPLLLLGRYSPPFLDYIESAQVTTRWANLSETLRGTTSWTPYLSTERVAGALLVTQPALIVATALVAAAGLAGLTLRSMPHRGRLITIALVGVTLLCLGWVGALGAPFAGHVRAFLDGPGAAFRNVHKFDPLLRLPLALGFTHLLSRVPVHSWADVAHPERQPRVAAGMVMVMALVVAVSPAWTLRLAPQGTYREVPDYWSEAAQWLAAHAPEPPSGGAGSSPQEPTPAARALVVPGANFASQLWGLTRDEPLQPLARSPWAVRDAIPLVPPNTIRAMDAVEQLVADGRPAEGLAATLAGQGIRFVVVRNDLNLAVSDAASPLLVHRTMLGSPGLRRVAQFGPATRAGVGYQAENTPQPVPFFLRDVPRPAYPAIEIFEVDLDGPHTPSSFPFGGPWLVDTDSVPLVVGGPEALSSFNDTALSFGQPIPTVRMLSGHVTRLYQQTVSQQSASQQAGVGPGVPSRDALPQGRRPQGTVQAGGPTTPRWLGLTITDSPKARETDVGRVDHHSSGIRSRGDTRYTGSRHPDYATDAAPLIYSRWYGGKVTVSSSAGYADQLGKVRPGADPAAAFDGNPRSAWLSAFPGSAVGQSLTVHLNHPIPQGSVTVTVPRGLPGSPVNRLVLHTNAGSAIVSTTPGHRTVIPFPPGTTTWLRISAGSTRDGSAGDQFGLSEVVVRDTSRPTASGAGTVVQIGREVVVGYPDHAEFLPPLLGWSLHQDYSGALPCADGPTGARVCDPSLVEPPEEPGVLRRTITTPREVEVTARMLVRLNSARIAQVSTTAPPHLRVNTGCDGGLALVVTPGSALQAAAWNSLENSPSFPVPQRIPLRLEGNSEDIAAALQRGETVPAVACQPSTVLLPAGEVRMEGHAGRNLVVDTLQLISPAGQRRLAEAARLRANHRSTPPRLLEWGNSVRRLEFGPSTDTRLLVVPESVNPGWQATLADGRMLQPTTANGWQQAWLVPANSEGVVTLRFTPNTPYRTVLGVGGVLVLLLIVLTVVGGVRLRRLDSPHSDSPLAWRWSAVTAPSPHPRQSFGDSGRYHWATLLTAAGTVLSGLLLAAHPWTLTGGHSYAGDHWLTQLCALIAVVALALATTPLPAGWRHGIRTLRQRYASAGAATVAPGADSSAASTVTLGAATIASGAAAASPPDAATTRRASQARNRRRNGSSTSA